MDHWDGDVTCLKTSAAGPWRLVMWESVNLENNIILKKLKIQYLVIKFHWKTYNTCFVTSFLQATHTVLQHAQSYIFFNHYSKSNLCCL